MASNNTLSWFTGIFDKKNKLQQNSCIKSFARDYSPNTNGMFRHSTGRDDAFIKYTDFVYYYNNVLPVRTLVNAQISAILSFDFAFENANGVINEKNKEDLKIAEELKRMLFKNNNNVYCTSWTDFVSAYFIGHYAGQTFINILVNEKTKELLRVDIVPSNLLTVSQDVDGFISDISFAGSGSDQGASIRYFRNTEVNSKPTAFILKNNTDGFTNYMFPIIHASLYEGGGIVAVSRLQPIKSQIETYDALKQHQLTHLRSGLHISGFLQAASGHSIEPGLIDVIENKLAGAKGVKNSGSVAMMPAGLEFVNLQNTIDKNDVSAMLQEIALAIYRFGNVPSSWFDNKATQFANQEQENKRYYTAIIPQLIRGFLENVNSALYIARPDLKASRLALGYDNESNVFVAELKIKEAMDLYKDGKGVITQDEAREKLNYAPLTVEQRQSQMATQSVQSLFNEIDGDPKE